MNPTAEPTNDIVSRFLRLFQKRERQRIRTSCVRDSHHKRGMAALQKRRRQIAQASRRDQRRLAKGQRR
jgi:hypothetical protein